MTMHTGDSPSRNWGGVGRGSPGREGLDWCAGGRGSKVTCFHTEGTPLMSSFELRVSWGAGWDQEMGWEALVTGLGVAMGKGGDLHSGPPRDLSRWGAAVCA